MSGRQGTSAGSGSKPIQPVVRWACLTVALAMLAGCTGPPGGEVWEGEPQVVESAGEPASESEEFQPLIEGSVSFATGDGVWLEFPADGTPQSVSVTDANGLTWELIVPADALAHPQDIGLTPLTDITSDLGEITGGVLLKPDGQWFLAPVTLRISGAAAGKAAAFSGSHEGDELALGNMQWRDDVLELQLLHFSTAFVTDSDALLDKLRTTAQTQLQEATKAARELAKKPIEAPVPPAIPNTCPTEDAQGDPIGDYLRRFQQPELGVIEALIGAMRNVMLTDADANPGFDDARGIALRLHRKAETLIKHYRSQDDMFDAVAAATLFAERGVGLLGEPLGERSLLPALAAWADHLATKYLTALRKHDYAKLVPAVKFYRYAALLGGAVAKHTYDELWGALTFSLRFAGTVTQERDTTASWVTSGVGEVSFAGGNEGYFILMGKDMGSHDSFVNTDRSAAQPLLTKEFETEFYVILDPPCYVTGRAGVTRLGAKDLTYHSDMGPLTVPGQYNLISKLVLGEYYDVALGAVMVEVELVSGEGVFEKPMTGTHEYTTADYLLTLKRRSRRRGHRRPARPPADPRACARPAPAAGSAVRRDAA